MKRFPLLLSAAAALTLSPWASAQNAAASDHANSGNATSGAPIHASAAGNVALPAPAVGVTPSNPVSVPSAPVTPATGPVTPPTGPVIPPTGPVVAGTTGAAGNGPAQPKAHTPDPHASAASAAVQSILQKFDASRDQIVQQRQALVAQLATAKDDTERKSIEQELKTEEQSMQAQARATAKEIRAELQALRRQHSAGGG